jgi:hypothetical protein
MGKKTSRRQAKPKPSWFDIRFDQDSSGFSSLRIPEANLNEFNEAIRNLFAETSLWSELMAMREPIARMLDQRDWSKASSWHLVHHLKCIGEINAGVEEFCPRPYRGWSLDVRQALYIGFFLIKGQVMLAQDPKEDFGFPDLAERLGAKRLIIPATRPLWHLLARPYVQGEIERRRRSRPGIGPDAAVLLVLAETREAEPEWLTLFNETSSQLVRRLAERFGAVDREWDTGNLSGLAVGQAYLTAMELQEHRSAGEVLARALDGEFEHFSRAVQNDLKDEHRSTKRHREEESEAIAGFKLHFINADTDAADEVSDRVRMLIDDPKTPIQLRRLCSLLRRNPLQTDKVLAHTMEVSEKTIRTMKASLREKLL